MDVTQEQIRDNVNTLMAGVFQLPIADVPADLAFGDIPQWDSFGHMELMVSLEDKFGVEISTETITELVNIPAICAYLEKLSH